MTTPFQQWLASSDWAEANQDAVEMAREAWNMASADTVAIFWNHQAVGSDIPLQLAVKLCDEMHQLRERETTQ